jgi:HAD superfamily hydrolase (TIGR01509 family)
VTRYDAVLFDFDGVLVDSEPVHFACWAELLQPVGIGLDWETYRTYCVGVADFALLEFFARLASPPLDPHSLVPLYARKQKLFRERMAQQDRIAPGAVDLMASLEKYALAVVTSSMRQEVEPVLIRAGLLPFFGAAVYGEDVERHKPAPDPYLAAAAHLGVTRPLVAEDSDSGIKSAEAAGFAVVRIASPGDLRALVHAAVELL